jgi:hypothetical protein
MSCALAQYSAHISRIDNVTHRRQASIGQDAKPVEFPHGSAAKLCRIGFFGWVVEVSR